MSVGGGQTGGDPLGLLGVQRLFISGSFAFLVILCLLLFILKEEACEAVARYA
jgi:hypothetical protein